MGKYGTLITLGIIVAFSPLLGIPDAWKAWLYTIVGAAIAVLAYFARRAVVKRPRRAADTFYENEPEPAQEITSEDSYADTQYTEETEYNKER